MATIGGLLIGAAAIILLSLTGRVAGISGILWGAITDQATRIWRGLFLLGLVAGGAAAHLLLGLPIPDPQALPTSWAVAGGLLVGMGTRMGNGCTSGHGVCGIGLHSRRSVTATVTFMASGIATVFVIRHVMGSGI